MTYDDVIVVIVTLDDVVGGLVEGFSKKGALRLGLFFLWPPLSRILFRGRRGIPSSLYGMCLLEFCYLMSQY